jgi:hypothetical protein
MDRWDAMTPIERPSAQPRDALPEFAAVPVAPTPTAAPATQRLKIKVGSNEFDAEGTPEIVQAQFEFFKRLIELESSAPPAPPASPKGTLQEKTPPNSEAGSIDARLGEIMKAEDDVVSLTVRGLAPGDAILLLLYGQKTLRDHDAVTSREIRADATATGEPPVNRADRLLHRAQEDGHVIVTGQGRGKRYRLTAEGLSKARELAAALIRR